MKQKIRIDKRILKKNCLYIIYDEIEGYLKKHTHIILPISKVFQDNDLEYYLEKIDKRNMQKAKRSIILTSLEIIECPLLLGLDCNDYRLDDNKIKTRIKKIPIFRDWSVSTNNLSCGGDRKKSIRCKRPKGINRLCVNPKFEEIKEEYYMIGCESCINTDSNTCRERLKSWNDLLKEYYSIIDFMDSIQYFDHI
jgi:hypothetical protein